MEKTNSTENFYFGDPDKLYTDQVLMIEMDDETYCVIEETGELIDDGVNVYERGDAYFYLTCKDGKINEIVFETDNADLLIFKDHKIICYDKNRNKIFLEDIIDQTMDSEYDIFRRFNDFFDSWFYKKVENYCPDEYLRSELFDLLNSECFT